jgi:hypothetical protein
MRKINEASLRRSQDKGDIRVAQKRLEDWGKGASETISLADLMKKYGLKD